MSQSKKDGGMSMNKNGKKTLSLFLSLILVLSLFSPAFAVENEQNYEGWDTIKVFETTDMHGYITDVSSYVEKTFQYRLAYIAKIVKDARASQEYQDVLLLDSGDIYQGTPHSNLTYGAALRAAFDKMGYDAVSLGNHEFDWDVQTYAADQNGTMAPYQIGGFQGDSKIPVLMYNLYHVGSREKVPFVQEYTVVEKAGYKVAILGYADDYRADIMAEKIAPYEIDGSLEKLAAKAVEVKTATNADILVILAHSDPKEIAEAMDSEVVDLVAGGHTHTISYGTAENGVVYIQGNYQARGYAEAEIKIHPETKDVAVVNPNYTEVYNRDTVEKLYDKNGTNTDLDPEIVAISKAAWDAVKDEMYEVLCTVDQDILKTPIQEGTTTSVAGNWLTGLMLDATADLDTIAAFTNSGGIRTSLTMAEGAKTRDITVADIYTIAPFGNKIYTFSITGKQLAQHLENALQGSYENSNYGDQFSGIVVSYYKVADGIRVSRIVTDKGVEIDINDTEKMYNVCVNQYNATLAGSVFENLTPLQEDDYAPIDNLSFIAALQARREAYGLNWELDTSIRAVEVAAPDTQDAASENPILKTTYVVTSGDCLWNITYQIYGTGSRWTEIYEANRDSITDPNELQVGQVLQIP